MDRQGPHSVASCTSSSGKSFHERRVRLAPREGTRPTRSIRRPHELIEHFYRKTLPHPGPLPLGEGESPSDGWLRQTTARFAKSIDFRPCVAGSLEEWLMERYIAFNSAHGTRRFFRVCHAPWPQRPAKTVIEEMSLLTKKWPWFEGARMAGANFSPGFDTVWMSRPYRCHE